DVRWTDAERHVDPHRLAVLPDPLDLVRGVGQEALEPERGAFPRTIQAAYIHAGGQRARLDPPLVELHQPSPFRRWRGVRALLQVGRARCRIVEMASCHPT